MMEILNIFGSHYDSSKRNAPAKVASAQTAETIDGSRVGGALCQQVSKSQLTLVEIGRQKAGELLQAARRQRHGGNRGWSRGSEDAIARRQVCFGYWGLRSAVQWARIVG